MFNGERLETFSSKSEIRGRYQLSQPFNISSVVLVNALRRKIGTSIKRKNTSLLEVLKY